MKNKEIEVGDFVLFDGEKYFVDNDDENFKEEDEERSLFILPIEFNDPEKYDKLFNSKFYDSTGVWVYEHLLNKILILKGSITNENS